MRGGALLPAHCRCLGVSQCLRTAKENCSDTFQALAQEVPREHDELVPEQEAVLEVVVVAPQVQGAVARSKTHPGFPQNLRDLPKSISKP